MNTSRNHGDPRLASTEDATGSRTHHHRGWEHVEPEQRTTLHAASRGDAARWGYPAGEWAVTVGWSATVPAREGWGRVMPGLGDLENEVKDHDDQIDQGLDKAGDEAKDKVGGHDDQIDAAVDKGESAL